MWAVLIGLVAVVGIIAVLYVVDIIMQAYLPIDVEDVVDRWMFLGAILLAVTAFCAGCYGIGEFIIEKAGWNL